MLNIKYNIAEDDIKFIKNLNAENIDDFRCLEGQFEIKIGKNGIGYVDEKISYNLLKNMLVKKTNKVINDLEIINPISVKSNLIIKLREILK